MKLRESLAVPQLDDAVGARRDQGLAVGRVGAASHGTAMRANGPALSRRAPVQRLCHLACAMALEESVKARCAGPVQAVVRPLHRLCASTYARKSAFIRV